MFLGKKILFENFQKNFKKPVFFAHPVSPGTNDIGMAGAANITECCLQCIAIPNCFAWVFAPNSMMCFYKSVRMPIVPGGMGIVGVRI